MKLWERWLGALGIFSILIFNMWYTHHAIEGSQRRQCDLINAQVNAFEEQPPETATGVALAEAYRTLKSENNC